MAILGKFASDGSVVTFCRRIKKLWAKNSNRASWDAANPESGGGAGGKHLVSGGDFPGGGPHFPVTEEARKIGISRCGGNGTLAKKLTAAGGGPSLCGAIGGEIAKKQKTGPQKVCSGE